MAEKALGFHFNQQFVSYALGIAALLGVFFTGATWINNRTAFETATSIEMVQIRKDMTDAIDRGRSTNEKVSVGLNNLDNKIETLTDNMNAKISGLSENMVQLSLDVRELQTLQVGARGRNLTGINVTPVPRLP